jgi:hypothetical protein
MRGRVGDWGLNKCGLGRSADNKRGAGRGEIGGRRRLHPPLIGSLDLDNLEIWIGMLANWAIP